MSFIECIRERFGNSAIKHCKEKGCNLNLENIRNHIILKGEKICRNRKICDCIIFIERNGKIIVVIVELKSRTVHVNEVVEKLQNALQVASEILNSCNSGNHKVEFILTILAKKWSSKESREYVLLIKKRKAICGDKKNCRISRGSCGTPLNQILNNPKSPKI
jgi:hypothetical protein